MFDVGQPPISARNHAGSDQQGTAVWREVNLPGIVPGRLPR